MCVFVCLMPQAVPPGLAPRGGIRGPCPPKRVTVPPTFNPLPSLLNVIDLESESETDKTAHIRKQLHTLVSISNCMRSQMVSLSPEPPYQASTHPAMIHPLYVTANAQCPFNLDRRPQSETSRDIYKPLFFC